MPSSLQLLLSAEERALGMMIGADWSTASGHRWPPDWPVGADTAQLLRLSVRHGVPAMLARALAESGIALPTALQHQVDARRRLLARHALAQQGVIAALADQARDADFLLLKGHALGAMLYADPLLRECADIDVLTDENGVAALAIALRDMGFTEKGGVAPHLGVAARTMLHDLRNARQFDRGDHLRVEIHHRLTVESDDFAGFGQLWRRRRTVTLLGREIPTLGEADTLTFLLLHGAKHGWEMWRWLTDLILALRGTSEDDARLARSRVGAALFDTCLALAAAISGDPTLAPARLPRRARPLALAALFVARADRSPSRLNARLWLGMAAWQVGLVRNLGDVRRQLDRLLVDARNVDRFSGNRSLLYLARPFGVVRRRLLATNEARRGRLRRRF